MLAGCSSSTLLSPRHRLREAPAQLQACHFQLPSMSTQRLDLPCSFSRKDTSRSQPIRPVGLSVEKPIESKTSSCSLKQSVRIPPLATSTQKTSAQTTFIEAKREIKGEFWEQGKSLKRLAEQGSVDDSCISKAKRKKGGGDNGKSDDILGSGRDSLSLGQLGAGNFWFQPSIEASRSVPGITDLGEKDGETSYRLVKEASGSSTSSDSQSLGHRLNENVSEQEVGNGSRNPYSHEDNEVEGREEDNQGEHQGFELVSLLTACVQAIGFRNIAVINHFIAKLGEIASPKGSPISRLSAYYTEALAIRVTRLWPHIFHITTPRELDRADEDSSTALRLLNQVSPIPKFLHFTSNEILLRAFEGKDRVHIIDFDIKQGLQWPSLFQSLASRTNPPSHVRITGIGESKQELNETGDRLAGFAEALNLPFEFHPVVDRLEDVRLWMLHVKEQECVAVNCIFQMHKTLYDGNGGALRDFLGLIRSTNPKVVIMAEQEAEHNDPRLETRASNSLKHYSAIFDSIDYSLPLDSSVRLKIEEMFAREIKNIIACEGRDRLERHESFERWRKLIEQGGFRCMGINEREMLQSQLLLKMYSCENFSVKKQGQDGAALTLSWLDQPLYTISAWAPLDVVVGSSSSYSQPS
ncbi:hypothetical protein I3843_12G097200 [Carya illinoinensis]|uniref:Scarecrow-like protein 28 n=1 Tax=Carya illinoinensis TaxID=32201 RepID=A0A922DIR0_CARIL|nr:hypothetical protein I3842_12G096400 [Carya illinoinensis]KAG7953183.1 hypothetical protein I3843_12G097200 [Carya illinoinensis]